MGPPQRLEGAVQIAGGRLPETRLLGAARIDQVLGDGAALRIGQRATSALLVLLILHCAGDLVGMVVDVVIPPHELHPDHVADVLLEFGIDHAPEQLGGDSQPFGLGVQFSHGRDPNNRHRQRKGRTTPPDPSPRYLTAKGSDPAAPDTPADPADHPGPGIPVARRAGGNCPDPGIHPADRAVRDRGERPSPCRVAPE